MAKRTELRYLSDRKNTYLTQLSYLEINDEGKRKIAEGGLTIAELEPYLEKREEPFCDSAGVGKDGFNAITKPMVGDEKVTTKGEIYDQLISSGMGDIKITDVTNNQNIASNGFQAMTFEDSQGNVGISYRGSDLDFSKGGMRDWIEADALEYFTGKSSQSEEALEYFNEHKNMEGNNYLYGHSLGGNLTSHVYLQNHDDVSRAFTINGNPINQKALDTPEKIAAFNDKEKFSCNIVSGDIVGHFKSCERYQDNVNYIQNNHNGKDSFIYAHLTQAASYDENGNFKKVSRDEMVQEMGSRYNVMQFCQSVRETFNEWEAKFENVFHRNENTKNAFESYKQDLDQQIQFNEKTFSLKDIQLDSQVREDNDRNIDLDEVSKIDLDSFSQSIDLEQIVSKVGEFVEEINLEMICMSPEIALGQAALGTIESAITEEIENGEIGEDLEIAFT